MSLRPSVLDPLFAHVSSLAGIGPKLAAALDRLLGSDGQPARVADLLLHLPTGAVHRDRVGSVAEAPVGTPVTLAVSVTAHRLAPVGRARAPHRVLVEDDTGDVTLVFFGLPPSRIQTMLPIGARRLVSGTIALYDGQRQMVHPSRVVDERAAADGGSTSEPVYGLTEGVTSRLVAKGVGAALARLPRLPEWQDEAWLAANAFPTFGEALIRAHDPAGPRPEAVRADEPAPADPARRRLAFDELLATQLALALVRARARRKAGQVNAGDGHLARQIVRNLPFTPTAAQERAVAEIRHDLASGAQMLRLLQGDVGSGKTLVALLAMASAVEAGRQAALVAPTEILARQHAARLAELAGPAGLSVGVLTGRDKAAERRDTLARLADGRLGMVVGTHALLGGDIAFRNLGLAVIDEQHRFGVHQRLALGAKGDGVDVLVMTATPIPRSLALTAFGDMDVSVLDDKPPGRKPISTRLVAAERLDEVAAAVTRAIGSGDLVYWVCPLVAESETVDVAAAEERHRELGAVLGQDTVVLVHGRMAPRDKDAAMDRFSRGDAKVLVATTVIEVGVDVPRATVMVVEGAERFGLAQLHQLRGRVGRGERPSVCLLVYKGPLGDVARARLETMRRTENGFEIAEEDLRLRGEGELLGTRQSGTAEFRLASLERDGDLLAAARDDARLIVERDPALRTARGQALRTLLYLFERDAAIRRLSSG